MTNLGALLQRAAADHPDHPALRLDDLVLTYGQLREAAGRSSALLAAHGVQPGDRVGIMLPNVPPSRSPFTAHWPRGRSWCR